MDEKQRKQIGFSIGYFLLALLGLWLLQIFFIQPFLINQSEVPYSQFRQDLAEGKIDTVTFSGDRIFYTCCRETDTPSAPEGEAVETPTVEGGGGGLFPWLNPPPTEGEAQPLRLYNVVAIDDPELTNDLLAADVTFSAEAPANDALVTLLAWLIPLLPLVLIWYFLFRRLGGDRANVLSIGKSKAREISGELTGITFADVGGAEEAEVELKEIIDFLRDPSRFTAIGAKLPKGVLLVGPPGTGKTLLGKATAGEAGVPFFSLSGSDFVEMFVGVGAARVRDLFEQAKAKAPCIVFIDEIDAIGQSRSTVGAIMTNDEREQTLNQLLAEMDGFEPNNGVVIMAATNRPEILDKALLRPGRFDRQIQVPLPTEPGRREILNIHTRNVKLAPDVDLDRIAQITPGFSGADLANIVNEAALLAVRQNRTAVTMRDFDLAIERVVAGLQRKTPLREEVRRKVAYHEGGHALVASLLPTQDPVHKVSIIPTARGALGYTMQMPEEDQYLLGEQALRERMAVMLGGRAAELVVFNELSTGAANDLEKVTQLARRMVTEFGMSEKLGPVRYVADAGMGYLGTQAALRPELGPETATRIDQEVRLLVEQAHEQAVELLRTHLPALHEIARVLQKEEAISGEQIKQIVAQTTSEQAPVETTPLGRDGGGRQAEPPPRAG
ncbi:MAG TPA: ATP-dependent zinc metalloprotease FtsH [Caldilineaceae bacterium]|nr:ATP-dependent zinc metalloprotease FtsH [Caldilineaceae bacterium]